MFTRRSKTRDFNPLREAVGRIARDEARPEDLLVAHDFIASILQADEVIVITRHADKLHAIAPTENEDLLAFAREMLDIRHGSVRNLRLARLMLDADERKQ